METITTDHEQRRFFMKRLMLVIAFGILSCSLHPTRADDRVPGSIKLLPGYQHKVGRGIDSEVGTISKPGGAIITFDIAGDAGVATNDKSLPKRTLWRAEQIVNGEKAVVVFTKSKVLIISFPAEQANFSATIRNSREMADVLLMILTYEPPTPKGGPN
jgi:hypothetical protein